MPRWKKLFLLLGLLLLAGLAACAGQTLQSAINEATPTVNASLIAYPLATPYAQLPAAGICAGFDGTVVTISIDIDIPDPRCAKVKPDQTLVVVNNTQELLVVTIGRFTANIKPGEKTLFNTPFGEYLEPGVHQLQVSPCCGAELWLEAAK